MVSTKVDSSFLSQGCDSLSNVLFMYFSEITALAGPICLKYWRETLSMAYIPFDVRFIAHCINCIHGHSGVVRKDKHFTFSTLC